MSLHFDLYDQAIEDLSFIDHAWREGTCPACDQHGLTLKLLIWPDGSREYEPFCPQNCTPQAINNAVIDRVDAQRAAKAA